MERPNKNDYTYSTGELKDPVEYIEALTDYLNYLEATNNFMPRELTSENGAKALLIGEFNESYEDFDKAYDEESGYNVDVPIQWTTIKEIYKKIVFHFEKTNKSLCLDWVHDERVKCNDDKFCPLCGKRLQN